MRGARALELQGLGGGIKGRDLKLRCAINQLINEVLGT